jgi:hypothetical protein
VGPPTRRTYVVSEALLELMLRDVAGGADPLAVLAEFHDHATRLPDLECAPGRRLPAW